MVSEQNYPNRRELLEGITTVLRQYQGIAVTDRQIHYRLVAAGVYPNTFKSYHNLLVPGLVKWRRDGTIDMDAIEDRTRRLLLHEYGVFYNEPLRRLKRLLQSAIGRAQDFELARWYRQPYKVLVAVEKQAMEGPFAQVCNELEVDLAVLRGYSSLSYTNEIAKHLKIDTTRKVVILYFGDLDPSGLNIPEVLERDLYSAFDVDFELQRVALTHEQVDKMNLIPAPVKIGDTRAAKFIDEHGEDVYELDAIEPTTLQQMIRTEISKYFDESIHKENGKLSKEGRDKINKALEETNIEDDIDSIPDDESTE
jgi:hypothetical protein